MTADVQSARAVSQDIAAAVRGETVLTQLLRTLAARGDEVALRWRAGEGWGAWRWRDYVERAARFATALDRLGVARGDRVALLMTNRPAFHVADLGTLLAGATPCSIFETSALEQVEYVLRHCNARVLVLGDGSLLAPLGAMRSRLPALGHVVVDGAAGPLPPDVVPFDRLLESPSADVRAAAARSRPDDLLTVVYTSGTTGPPKGVMIAHANVCWWVESVSRALGAGFTPAGKRQVSFLPMAAMAERCATHYLHLMRGTDVTTCPDPRQLDAYLRHVRPQIFLGVPRVWERLHAGIWAAVAADPARQEMLSQAVQLGRRLQEARAGGAPVPRELEAAWQQAEALALRRLRETIGLDACEIALTGSAPTPPEVVWFFLAIGVPLSESYGLSESTAITLALAPRRPGAGRPIPGCELRLLPDGEVVLRSGNLFRGYLDDPTRTAEAVDAEGWLHTGDIGRFDDDGFLQIVDRKKELVVTPDGRNVSPANVEATLKASTPLIGQACVMGDRHPFLIAILVLDPQAAPAWAAARGLVKGTLAELSRDATVHDEIQRCVEQANGRLSAPERVERFLVLDEEWAPGSDELTPTMKLRRKSISTKYAAEIDALYATAAVTEPAPLRTSAR